MLNIFFFSCGVVVWGSASSVYGGYAAALCGVSVFAVAFFGVYVALKESYKYSIYVRNNLYFIYIYTLPNKSFLFFSVHNLHHFDNCPPGHILLHLLVHEGAVVAPVR